MTTDTDDRENGRWRFANASFHARSKYVTAHPNSALGDPNYADKIGYQFVSYTPEGLLVYCRKDSVNRGLEFFPKLVGVCGLFGIALVLMLFQPEFLNPFKIGIVLAVLTGLYLIDIVAMIMRKWEQ